MMAQQGVESSAGKPVSLLLVLLAVTVALHGCIESDKCPDMVPIANGKVKMECKKDGDCEEKETKCDSGHGYGILTENVGAEMRFNINIADNCVMKFTKAPPYCHKCLGDKVPIEGGSVTIAEGAKQGAVCYTHKALNFECDSGSKGVLSQDHDYECEESAPDESAKSFCVFSLTSSVCAGSKTKVQTTKITEAPKNQAKVTPTANAQEVTPTANAEEATPTANVDKTPNSFVHVEQKQVQAHKHDPAHHDDDGLPHLDTVRPWVLDAHAAARREHRDRK